MYEININHRDLYINHFLVNRDRINDWQPGHALTLNLIDLHRAQHRSYVPHRWLIKDLASLLFSALDVGLTSADCVRYLHIYLGPDWKASIGNNTKLWQATIRRACRLYIDFHGKSPKLPVILRVL